MAEPPEAMEVGVGDKQVDHSPVDGRPPTEEMPPSPEPILERTDQVNGIERDYPAGTEVEEVNEVAEGAVPGKDATETDESGRWMAESSQAKTENGVDGEFLPGVEVKTEPGIFIKTEPGLTQRLIDTSKKETAFEMMTNLETIFKGAFVQDSEEEDAVEDENFFTVEV